MAPTGPMYRFRQSECWNHASNWSSRKVTRLKTIMCDVRTWDCSWPDTRNWKHTDAKSPATCIRQDICGATR